MAVLDVDEVEPCAAGSGSGSDVGVDQIAQLGVGEHGRSGCRPRRESGMVMGKTGKRLSDGPRPAAGVRQLKAYEQVVGGTEAFPVGLDR